MNEVSSVRIILKWNGLNSFIEIGLVSFAPAHLLFTLNNPLALTLSVLFWLLPTIVYFVIQLRLLDSFIPTTLCRSPLHAIHLEQHQFNSM